MINSDPGGDPYVFTTEPLEGLWKDGTELCIRSDSRFNVTLEFINGDFNKVIVRYYHPYTNNLHKQLYYHMREIEECIEYNEDGTVKGQ